MTRTTVLGWMLAATACNSMALSLGRPHGPAVLGQPLAVSFDLRLDAEDNVESACIEAEVIQGDTRIAQPCPHGGDWLRAERRGQSDDQHCD